MGNESPKAQISGGKAARFANALRTTRSTCVAATDSRKSHPLQVSILLPKTSQIILDKVVVLDKGTASVNAPPPLHRKITISSRLSVTHTQQ
jgi:hypothetical protein